MLGPDPESHVGTSKNQGKDIIVHLVFPVLVQVIVPKLLHEFHKGQGNNTFTVSCNPVMDSDVLKAGNDHCNLFVNRDRFGDKEVLQGVLKVHHDSRGDIPHSQDRCFHTGGIDSCSRSDSGSGHDVGMGVNMCSSFVVRGVRG